MADVPPPPQPSPPKPPAPQRAKKKAAAVVRIKKPAAATVGPSAAQLTLYNVLPRAAAGALSGGHALLRVEEDRRRYEEQQRLRQETPFERDLRQEMSEPVRAARENEARATSMREERQEQERGAADAHARPASAVVPVIAYNPYAGNVPPIALTHVEDRKDSSRQRRIFPEVPESRWCWPIGDERRLSFEELLYRELYIFQQCYYLREQWQRVLSWQGNYGRMYKLLTHPIGDAYRLQEMADMEAACAAAQISRRFKPSRANPAGKIVYARPKDKFYTSTVKAIEGAFYSHLDQMNQIGDCDMLLLTVIPRPGIANASLAAAWLEVPKEMAVIYEALKNWRGLVRFVLTVDVHPGPGKQRSTAKPAAGEMNGPSAPRPRDDMDGVHDASARPQAKPKAAAAKPGAAEGPAPGALAKPAGTGPRKPMPRRRLEMLAKKRAAARGVPSDEREATAGVGAPDAEAEAPPSDEDADVAAALERRREASTRATGLTVAPPPAHQLPPARAYAENIQQALAQSRFSGGALPRAGLFFDEAGTVVVDSRNRGGGPNTPGLKGGARRRGGGGGGGEDEVVLHDGDDEVAEPAGEAIDPEEPVSEDDPEELAAEEELMQEIRPEDLEDASDLSITNEERARLEQAYSDAQRHLATLLYLAPSRPDVHDTARAQLETARRALEERGLRVPGEERETPVEEGEEDEEEVNAHEAAYLAARKRAKLDNADQSKLLKWHPHYHVSVTFTKMSGVAAPDLGMLKAELQNRGLKDVNIKRSYKPGINNWNKIERYPLVTANDPLVHRFLLAVNHERISVNGVDVGPEYEYPERFEAHVLHHRMRSAVEYTNRDVLSHVPDFYKRLEHYYYALRTASTNVSGEREIPSLSEFFDNARAQDLSTLEAISQPLSERTSYVKQLQDFMRRENLKVKRIGKGEKDFAVYAPVSFKPRGERHPLRLDTAHELLCPNLDAFHGYIIQRGLRELDSHFSRTGQGIWKSFAPLVTGAIAKDGVREDEEDYDAAIERRPDSTVLPTFFKSKRWLAFGEGWFFLCDDPHNPATDNARLRLRYLRKYCCVHDRHDSCIYCRFYVNLPVWFPLPRLKYRPPELGPPDVGQELQCVTWPSPFLYRWAFYRDHMARALDSDTVGVESLPERSQESLVVERLNGASCYFVSKTYGKIYAMDNADTPQGDARWHGPRNWLKAFERYWKPPCTHNWKRLPDTEARKNHWICEAKHRRADGSEEICGDIMPGHQGENPQQQRRPKERIRKSWGLEATLDTLDIRRQAYQRFVNAQLVLVIWGETRTGKTAFVMDLGPDGGCFQKDDIFMVGKGEADVFGRLRENTAIAWLNEYNEWKMRAVDFKAFAEGSSMNARGMYESGSIMAARFFKLVSMNGVYVTKQVPLKDAQGAPLLDEQGVPRTRTITGMKKPFDKKYDKDGAVGARLHMVEMSIHPPTQDQELSMRIAKDEWDEILVYQMTLKYVPLERRAAWRQKKHMNVSRDRGDGEDMMDAEGSQLPPPPPPQPPTQPPLRVSSNLITVAAPGQGSGDEEEDAPPPPVSILRQPRASSQPSAGPPPPPPSKLPRVRLRTSQPGILGGEDTVMAPGDGEDDEEAEEGSRRKKKSRQQRRVLGEEEDSSSAESTLIALSESVLDAEDSVLTRLASAGSTSNGVQDE